MPHGQLEPTVRLDVATASGTIVDAGDTALRELMRGFYQG